MKDTARKTTRRQEATPQLAFAAMIDASLCANVA